MLGPMRLAAWLLVIGLGLPGFVAAQESDENEPSAEELAEARQLFDDGLRYVQDRLFGRAAIAFRRAAEIKPAPAVLYNLAAAEFELGEHVEAATHARRVVDDEAAPPELVERARTLLRTARSKVAMLVVNVGGTAESATVDGEALSADQLGRLLFLAPGAHTVVALQDGESVAERRVEIAAGVEAHVDITSVPSAEEVAVAAVEPEPEESDHVLSRAQLGLVVGGSGLLLTIITAIIVFVAAG